MLKRRLGRSIFILRCLPQAGVQQLCLDSLKHSLDSDDGFQ